MLEQLRRNSRSILVWALFAIIISTFVVFFGPQASHESFSCSGSTDRAARVEGKAIPASSWRFAMMGLRFGSEGGYQERHTAIDFLVERELLAQAAEESGFRISEEDVNDHIKNGDFFVLGFKRPAPWFHPDGSFDYELLERTAHSLGQSAVKQFLAEQRREYLAETQRELLLATGIASEEEARTAFLHDQTRVKVDYVKFPIERYVQALQLSDANLARYAEGNVTKIEKEWEIDKSRWTTDREWVRARHIFFEKKGDAEKADGAANAARARAQKARERLIGGADFGTVASEVSEDDRTKLRGGSLGWRPADSLGYGEELVTAASKLKEGETSDLIETPRGFHVIKVEKRKKGALELADVRLDLAARLAAKEWGREAARAAAEAALASAKGKALSAVFIRAPKPADSELPQDLPPEIIEQLRKQIPQKNRQLPRGKLPRGEPPPTEKPENGKQGYYYYESEDIPAQLGGEPAAKTPATKRNEHNLAKPASVPVPNLPPPLLESVGPAPRGEFLAGVGRSKELLDDLFDRIEVGKVSDRVYKVSDSDGFVIVQLTDRQDADLAQFEKRKARLQEGLALQKGIELLYHWVQRRCREVTEAGMVEVNPSFLSEPDQTEKKKASYQTCQFLTQDTVEQQVSTRLTPMFGF
jgi:parvulin-like peptidyl-prolyl isomerase